VASRRPGPVTLNAVGDEDPVGVSEQGLIEWVMQQTHINTAFWQAPPWSAFQGAYRLGLRPIELDTWFSNPASVRLLHNKRRLLTQQYDACVAVMPGREAAQSVLCDLPFTELANRQYPDFIADVSATVAEDLCLIDAADQQRLVAACVCAPSYWCLSEKIGLPLALIHAPVPGLNEALGPRIQRFFAQAPLGQPFTRANWFVHADDTLFHPSPEGPINTEPQRWFVRSERQTVCRLDDRYVLFGIEVVCEPLRHIADFPMAREGLQRALLAIPPGRGLEYFGGADKVRRLSHYLGSL